MGPRIFVYLFGALLFQRGIELLWSRRNQARLEARGGHRITDDVYRGIVLLHVTWFVAMGAEWALAPWAGLGGWTYAAAGLFIVGQVLRHWSMSALGDRWTTTIHVLPGIPPVTKGPYRWLQHPIYVGVVLELLAFPLISGLWVTAVVATLVNLPLLRLRIRKEEAAIRAAAGQAP